MTIKEKDETINATREEVRNLTMSMINDEMENLRKDLDNKDQIIKDITSKYCEQNKKNEELQMEANEERHQHCIKITELTKAYMEKDKQVNDIEALLAKKDAELEQMIDNRDKVIQLSMQLKAKDIELQERKNDLNDYQVN